MKSCFFPAGMHMDPVLREGQLAYSRFVSDQWRSRYMKVTLSPVVESGVFFVLKKESSLRTILDARKANRYVRRLLVALTVTDECLSNIGMDLTESGQRWSMTSVCRHSQRHPLFAFSVKFGPLHLTSISKWETAAGRLGRRVEAGNSHFIVSWSYPFLLEHVFFIGTRRFA